MSLFRSLRKPLKTKFTPTVSSVYSLSLYLPLCLSLSLSLSLSLRVSTLEKKARPLSTVDPKQKFAKPQFQVYSFFSGLRVQHVEVALRARRVQRRCYVCGIENKPQCSSPDWPAPADIAECCHQIQVSKGQRVQPRSQLYIMSYAEPTSAPQRNINSRPLKQLKVN